MRKLICSALASTLFVFAALTPVTVFSATQMKVEEASICRNIEDRAPVNAGSSFMAGVPKLYCYTRIEGAAAPTTVTHVWYYGNREMARVTLPVNFNSWRTYSSITFYQNWPGKWSVAVLSPDNDILKVLTFTIERRKSP